MRDVERFAALLCVSNIEEWRKQIFQIANDSGFQQTRVAILPDPKAPIEAEHAFQHSAYFAQRDRLFRSIVTAV